MRVVMLSKACVVGAYQTKLEELAALPGVELTAVVPPAWRDERGVLELERQHVTGYDLVVEPMAFNGHFHTHFYPGLGRVLRRARPDLVHIDEEPYNFATAHALWLARRLGARSLFFSWQNLIRRYPLPFRILERYVLGHVDGAIVGNHEATEVWRRKGYRGSMAVIPQFGVDPSIYRPEQERVPGRGFLIGYVGRLVEEKGVDLLLHALSTLPGTWRACILGSGPERQALEDLARRLGLGGRVTFDGWIGSAGLPAYYRQLDVLVVPSRTRPNWKEQFGRVAVEAMACGVPVVGSDSGEIPHVLDDAGLIFPENDVAALAAQLLHLMQDAGLQAGLARRGRQRVLERFTQARVAAETYQVYRTILAR